MLKQIQTFEMPEHGSVELFQTNHAGPDFHVRYGLQVTHFHDYREAYNEFRDCCNHLKRCAS